jgi:hypothetical protein
MAGHGFLAIWTEIEQEHFAEYRHWLAREHIGQRIFAPGFLGARVHVSVDNERAHFILYATESVEVLLSRDYIDLLNNPTPWTRRMMPLLRKFDRGAGEQIVKIGDGTGAWLLVSRLSSTPHDILALNQVLAEALRVEGVVTARLFLADCETSKIETTEKTMRSSDEGTFGSLLVFEATSDEAAARAEAVLRALIVRLFGTSVEHDVARYRFIYALHPFEKGTSSWDLTSERS